MEETSPKGVGRIQESKTDWLISLQPFPANYIATAFLATEGGYLADPALFDEAHCELFGPFQAADSNTRKSWGLCIIGRILRTNMDTINPLQPSRSAAAATSRSFFGSKREGSHIGVLKASKGPFGLTTLAEPSGPVVADLIFVHGMGGGSRSTWTKSKDESMFWPGEWLPHDSGFQDVRIHTFGYNSNWEKESTLNIQDFAKALLGAIKDCPTIPRTSDAPLILLGHSMGGLVIKKAYILARQFSEFDSIAKRTRVMFFLATPHRGADLAKLMSKILNLTSGARPFIADLHRNSLATHSINDEFPRHCQELQLYSFYETIAMNIGIGKRLIVDKDMATLGYSNEQTAYLNANHRDVCRYATTSDSNYLTIRNALASVVDTFRSDVVLSRSQLDGEQERLIKNVLGVSDAPEEEFMGLETLRLQGSCEWLLKNQNFQPWRDSAVKALYWITAKPATGKSVLSAYVINHLRDLNRDCAYYFFNYSDNLKTTISGCLRSLAWQMAIMHPNALQTIVELCKKENQLKKADYRIVWRKLFLDGIFRLNFDRPQYWIIDALDECKADHELVPLLLKAAEMSPVRIFLTSRNHIASYRQSTKPTVKVLSEEIRAEDTNSDIALYLEAHMDQLPKITKEDRQHMETEILKKSVGCFLWVSLVLQELRQVHTSAEIRQVLEEIPSDMDPLYSRILETMSKAPYGKMLAKSILVWTVCSVRPLTVQELHDALQIDIRDNIDSIERCIAASCGQLVYMDTQSRVQMIHQTARDFLLRADFQSEFAIERRSGHKRLVMTCLQYLNGNEMNGPRHRKLSVSNTVKQRSHFIEYACTAFSEHIAHISSTDDEFLAATTKFLNSTNVLSWIEYIAKYSDLVRLVQTGKALENYLRRRSKHMSLIGKEVALLDSWATDFVRIVTKFGKNLTDSPASIFNLIPLFCPPETATKRQFAASTRGIAVLGLSARTWDDCVSTIVYPQERALALASSDLHFAIGLSTGRIVIYHDKTCQEVHVFQHHEPVRVLQFEAKGNLLASAGNKILRVWNLTSWQQLWEFKISKICMSLAFADDGNLLLGALKSNTLMFWDLTTGLLRDSSDWTQNLQGPNVHAFRCPTVAAFGMQSSLLAIVYRGQDILLWDLGRDSIYETYSKDVEAGVGRRAGNATVWNLVFSTSPAATLLAASYSDGDLLLFDLDNGKIKETRIGVNAQTLASSSDGRTLATGDSAGTIQIFDFETLRVLYRIKSDDWGIKSLVFSSDCRRLMGISGFYAQVWDPPALVRQDADQELSDTVSNSTDPQEVVPEYLAKVNLITSLACHSNAGAFLCGKENGTIGLHDTKSGQKNQDLLYHATGCSIEHLYLDEESFTVSSIDSSSRLMTHRLWRDLKSWNTSHSILDHRIGISVQQLLSNKSHTRLLVSSFGRDTLWSIAENESTVVGELLWEARGPSRWMTHPENRDQLILVTDNVAHLYDWSTLSRLTEEEDILLEGAIITELAIVSMVPCFNGKYIATKFAKPRDSKSKSRLLLWKTADFSLNSQVAVPSPHYQALADHITFLIGQYGHRLVFLHSNGWIYSAGPETFNLETCVKHFFIPADWLSTNAGDPMIEMCQNGDIIFVKRHEAAVIKRGLDQIEQGDSATSTKRPSLTVPILH